MNLGESFYMISNIMSVIMKRSRLYVNKYLLFVSLSFICFLSSMSNIYGQCTNPPSGVDCLCSTATLLCTPDLLEGFTFSMSTTNNFGGFPNGGDLCPGLPPDGVPNNVNWFSFIAWCTDLSMDVHISNCSQGTFNTYGVQIGLFAGCPPSAPVECITDGFDACGNAGNYPTLHNFSATGLTIGNVYYFMLDGCAGSACDVMIDVIGVCGTGMIDPWTTGLTGPLETCVGNTDTYVAEDLDGAVEFYYYLDGTLIDDGTEQTTTDITWTTPGTYELCVDVSNLPCIPESDPPLPNCITIVVCDEAEAGDINLVTSPACPGDVVDITITNNTTGPDHDQYIIITDNTGAIIEVIVGAIGDFTHDECETFNVFSYNLKIGSPVPVVGMFFPNDYPCDDSCCDVETDVIIFEDDLPPDFDTHPTDLNLDCLWEVPAIMDLSYTDNCVDPGTVTPVESGSADLCTGGTLFRTWTVMDSCENVSEHTQSIDVMPLDPPQFITTPGDLTFNCGYTSGTIPDLTYENTQGGICFLSGTVPGVLAGMSDICGGNLTIDWEYTDTCANVITHTQNIVVDPAPEASWVNLPAAAITIDCDGIPATIDDLEYDNGETGTCEIAGMVPATTTNNYDVCGGTITNDWTFTDECDRTITYSQVITINPAPEASFQGTLPVDMTVSCDAVPTSVGDLLVSNGEMGVCLIEQMVSPTIDDQSDPCGGSITYLWEFIDDCGRPISTQQVITIDPAPIPTLSAPPSDITVDCDNIPSASTPIDYDNGISGACNLSGTINGVLGAFDVCTGEITEMWDGTDACGNVLTHQRIITVEPIDPIVFDSPPADVTLSCDAVPSSFPTLTFTNNASGLCLIDGDVTPSVSGSYNSCGGTLTITWSADDGCGTNIDFSQIITVEEAPEATFTNPPIDITVSCDLVPDPSNLPYSNGLTGNCAIDGEAIPNETGSFNVCGGSLVYEWSFTDDCGRTITESQSITVTEAPQAEWIDPPNDITLSCGEANNLSLNLFYSNNISNPCLISGFDAAAITGGYDACGGAFTLDWEHVDACGRTLTHSQEVFVNPAADPVFIDPPVDVTLDCGIAYSDPDDLLVDNGEFGNCAINEIIEADVSQNGNVYTHTWEFENPCDGSVLIHEQTVTISTAPDISINPASFNICEGDLYDLSDITVTDANGTSISLEYYEGNPINPFNLLDSPIVNPDISTIYTILAINEYGCTDEAIFSLIIDERPYAGEDGSISICDNISVNLFEQLGGVYDIGGVWLDLDAAGVDLDDPNDVLFTGLEPGAYEFAYQVSSNNTCPDDEAIVTVVFNQLGEIIIDSVYCTDGNNTYTVVLQDFGYGILPNYGEWQPMNNGISHIINVPVDQVLVINFYDLATFCADFTTVNPPDCDCPQVPLAEAEDVSICLADLPGILMANADASTTINWFDVASGGTALLENNSSFTSPEIEAGVYTYYIETESIEFPGCVSSIRVPITLTIANTPSLNNPGDLSYCLESGMNVVEITLQELNILFNSNLNNTFKYYYELIDLQNDENEIDIINLGMTDSIYLYIENVAGCSNYIGFEIIINEAIQVEVDIINELCQGDENGSISLDVLPISEHYEIIFNDQVYYGTEINDIPPGEYPIFIVDTVALCALVDTITILEGLSIEEESLSFTCDNNGTDTDPSDDIITLEFEFSNSEGNTNYELFIDNISQGIFDYDIINTIQLPTSIVQLSLQVVDESTGCIYETLVGPFFPCSTNCQISVNSFTQVCNDQGTPSDPSDDTYDFQINASAINSSASYNVLINGTAEYTFNYDEDAGFSLPADGTTPTIILVDVDDQQCTFVLDVLELSTCSDLCDITIEETTVLCVEDIYTINIIASILNGANASTIQLAIDDGDFEDYNINNIEFTMNADELNHWIYIQDLDDPACIDSIEIGPLDLCSTNCKINIDPFEYSCSDNGTPLDPTDDIYSFEWFATSVDGSADSIYNLFIDDVFVDSYEYSSQAILELPADGVIHEFEFFDNSDVVCKRTLETLELIPCSDSCVISLEFLDIYCDNNATNNTEDDDVFYVTIQLSSINAGTQWTFNSIDFYDFDTDILLGPFNIQDGDVNLDITNVTGNCTLNQLLSAPPTCSSCEQIISAGDDDEINCQNPTAHLIGTSSEPGNYNWEGPSGIISMDSIAIGTEEGWYYFVVNYSDGCSAIDSLYIEAMGEIPLADAGPDSLLTCLNSEIKLFGSYTTNSSNISLIWRNELGEIVSDSSALIVNSDGIYTFQIIDNETGCASAVDEVIINLDIEDPNIDILVDPGNILNCYIELINLNSEGQQDVSYEWIDGGGSSFGNAYEVNSPGTIILIAIDTVTGCQAMDSVLITQLEEFPIINIDPIDILNCENSSISISAANSIPANTSIFTWFDINGEPLGNQGEIAVDEAGMYIIEMIDTISGCENRDTLEVFINENFPILTEGEDLVLPCNNDDGSLFVEVQNSDNYNISWSTDIGSFIGNTTVETVQINGIGQYFVQVVDQVSNCVSYDTIDVTQLISEVEFDQLDASDVSCFGENDGIISWGNIEGGTEPYEIYLNDQLIENSDNFIESLEPGEYEIQVIDSNGCEFESLLTISEGPQYDAFTEPSISINQGETSQIVVETNIPANEISEIIWEPTDFLSCTDCLNPISNPPNDITYVVTIIDINGCFVQDSVTILVREKINIFVPNTFSPNDDGQNDQFTIYSNGIEEIIELAVYNRWGEQVFLNENFAANDPNLGWDGKFKEKSLNPGVFAFYAIVLTIDGATEVVSGDVTIIK